MSRGQWRNTQVKHIAEIVNGYPFDASVFRDSGDVPIVRIRDILADEFATFVDRDTVPATAVVHDDDIVIGMDGDFNSVLWSRGDAALNQRLCIARTRPNADPRFLAYGLPGSLKAINEVTYATTVKHLSSGQVANIAVALPPFDEQVAIADYLDHETAKIDTLIAKQEALISTLRERSRRLGDHRLSSAVGDGERLKWLVREVDVRAGEAWAEHPLLSVSISSGVKRRSDVSDVESRSDDLSSYKVALAGDLVVNRMRAFQGALGVATEIGIVSPDYAVLRSGPRVDSRWLATTMRTQAFVTQMVLRLKGIGGTESGAVRTPRINVPDLLDIEIGIPSLATQHDQLREVEVETSRIDGLIAKTEQFIALTKERRAALITAAVAGDVSPRA